MQITLTHRAERCLVVVVVRHYSWCSDIHMAQETSRLPAPVPQSNTNHRHVPTEHVNGVAGRRRAHGPPAHAIVPPPPPLLLAHAVLPPNQCPSLSVAFCFRNEWTRGQACLGHGRGHVGPPTPIGLIGPRMIGRLEDSHHQRIPGSRLLSIPKFSK